MNAKEKMMELIKNKKQDGGKFDKKAVAHNDQKNMRKGPKIYNK